MGIFDSIKSLFGKPATNEAIQSVSSPSLSRREEEPELDEDDSDVSALADSAFEPWTDIRVRNDMKEFLRRNAEIQQAQMQGPAELSRVYAKYQIRDDEHYGTVSDAFHTMFAGDPGFTQAFLDAQTAATRDTMKAASATMLEPIEGVDVATWGTISARRAALPGSDPLAFAKLLAEYGLDEPRFERAQDGWMKRMQNAADPMGAAGVATEYSKAFAAAGQGQFGAGAQAASAGLGLSDRVGAGVSGAAPVTFERWCEVGAAQEIWAQQGHDVNAMLKRTFGMTAADWSNISTYWGQKLMTDYTLAIKMEEVKAPYRQRYLSGEANVRKGDLDSDLSF